MYFKMYLNTLLSFRLRNLRKSFVRKTNIFMFSAWTLFKIIKNSKNCKATLLHLRNNIRMKICFICFRGFSVKLENKYFV